MKLANLLKYSGQIMSAGTRRTTQSDFPCSVNRRRFLASSGVAAASAVMPPVLFASAKKTLPIGVFTPVYRHLSLDEMLDKISNLGLEAVEVGAGGYSATPQCPLDELVGDPAKARAWKKKFEDRGI